MMEGGLLWPALKDAAVSFIFIFVGSTAGATVMILGPYFGTDESSNLVLLLSVIAVQIAVFGALAEAMGGASFNPTGNIANYCIGEGGETVLSLGTRILAQLAGSILGALAIVEVMPAAYAHTLGGPKVAPGIAFWTAVGAEGALTFAVNVVVLSCIFAGPANAFVKMGTLMGGVLVAIVLGAPYTGPAMNPAMAFAWAYVRKEHTSSEHFYVYWLAPIVGTVLAGIVFSMFIRPKRIEVGKSAKDKKNVESVKGKETVDSISKKTS